MKKLIIITCIVLGGYQYITKPPQLSARTLDNNCDAVVFTQATCPYCTQARNLLNNEKVNWCEKDINVSSNNYDLYKELGGKGVPFAVIGEKVLRGYNKNQYLNAINKI